MGKNVAVFVDVANIFYAAKAAGVDIDYVTLLKASSAGRDLVRAYAYTGLDPDNENQRNFHDFLRRHGYKVVSKDIRKYGDGKVKANLDIELVVDMMKTARNLDIAIVVSGDGDFAPAIRAVQEQGVRVEVVSFRGNTSSDLMDVADQFTDITQIAKVEKGSSRSGRRVAGDEADLSMTEVPDKQSEGTGDRGRGRGRTRRTATTGTATRRSGRATEPRERDAGEAPLVVLPGERLSRVAASAVTADLDEADADEQLDAVELDGEAAEGENGLTELGTEDGRRRRRRRGGRGRGRGRAREGVAEDGVAAAAGNGDVAEDLESDDEAEEAEETERAPSPARRAASSFGSVWDSQIGIQAGARPGPVVEDDEDLEEPAIPEYLIAERRRRDSGRGGGGGGRGRGRGGAYAAALDRERFGGGRGSTPSRFAEPPRREGGYGRPDRPDRPDRDRGGRPDRDRGGFRDAPRSAPRGSGDEPWSEVPPEIEAMLRAQMGSRGGDARRPAPARPAPERDAPEAVVDVAPATEAPAPAARRGRGRTKAEAPADAPVTAASEDSAPARSTRSRTRKPAASPESAPAEAAAEAGTEPAAPAKRTRTARSSSSATTSTTRRTRASSAAPKDEAATAEAAPEAAPKRRTTRRKAEPAA